MVCVGARLGTERTSAVGAPSSRACQFSFTLPRFLHTVPPCARYSTTKPPSSCYTDTRRPTRPNRIPSRSHRLHHFPFLSTSRLTVGQHLLAPSHYHVAAVRTFFHLF